MKIRNRYLLGRLGKTFLFLLGCLFVLYTIVDLSIHGVRFFSNGGTSQVDIALYYVHNFANHLELFFPLAWLLSMLKVLLECNAHHEFIALQMAGISRKKLFFPFFSFALLLSLLSYGNLEWIAPTARQEACSFQKMHAKKRSKKALVYSAQLQDQSELIYQGFEETTNDLFDVFWIKNSNDIRHIKYLAMGEVPRGRCIDFFRRVGGKLEKTESFAEKSLPEIKLDNNVVLQTFIPFENRSLSTLFQQTLQPAAEQKSVSAHFHYKLAIPLIPFLILIGLGPLAVRFDRSSKALFIVSIGLFAFIGFMTVLEGMLILSENLVIPGVIAIWGPILTLLGATFPRFAKM